MESCLLNLTELIHADPKDFIKKILAGKQITSLWFRKVLYHHAKVASPTSFFNVVTTDLVSYKFETLDQKAESTEVYPSLSSRLRD